MQIGPGNAILELCKSEKVSTQFQVTQLLVISLYGITKCVPDPFISIINYSNNKAPDYNSIQTGEGHHNYMELSRFPILDATVGWCFIIAVIDRADAITQMIY